MTENIGGLLSRNVASFINNECRLSINKNFKIYYFDGNSDTNYLPIIYDDINSIQCLMNIPKQKQNYLIEKNEFEIKITSSFYDLFFYKKNENINCIPIIVINDINVDLSNENYLEFNSSKIVNIGSETSIINNIKNVLKNKITKKFNAIQCNQIFLDNFLLNNNLYNFLNLKTFLFNNDNVKSDIDRFCGLNSKIQIRYKNNIHSNEDINTIFMEVIDIYDPYYKSKLMQKYMCEMPKSIFNLMEKYQNKNITREKFVNFQNRNKNCVNLEENKKNKNNENIEKKKKMQKNDKKSDNGEESIFMLIDDDKSSDSNNSKNDSKEKIINKIIFDVQKEKQTKQIFSIAKK